MIVCLLLTSERLPMLTLSMCMLCFLVYVVVFVVFVQ